MNEEESSWASRLTMILVIMVVIAGAVGFLWYKSATNPKKDALDKQIADQKTEIAILKGRQQKVTSQAINEEIKQDNIDINKKLNEVESKLNQGFTAVYSQTKSEDDYNKLKDTLPNLVGESLSDKLLEIDKPVLNQSGKGQVAFDNLDNLEIDFGKYDTDKKKLDGVIVADYTTPKISTASAGEKETDSVQKGQNLFKVTVDLEKDSIQLNDYANQIKGGNSVE